MPAGRVRTALAAELRDQKAHEREEQHHQVDVEPAHSSVGDTRVQARVFGK
jgi:hypothetical protein